MFNKDNKSINKVELNNLKVHTKDDKLLTQSFAIMLSNYHDDVMMKEQMDFQDKKTTYINKKYENSIKKQYNPKIVNLYQNGLLCINSDEYKLTDLYIIFDDNKNDFHIKSVKKAFDDIIINYNKAIKFIDTTAFINLINNNETTINENRLIINNRDILTETVNNWDGYLHSETKETDAITNKKMIRNDING